MTDLPWDRYGPPITEPVASPEPITEPELPYKPPASASSFPASAPAAVQPSTPQPADVGKDLVKADAASRSKRTLIQGLAFDLFAAVVASVALLSGADPFVRETWIGFGVLLIKSVVSAAISYFMRLRKAPTMRTRGEKYAIAPLPRPIPDNERQSA